MSDPVVGVVGREKWRRTPKSTLIPLGAESGIYYLLGVRVYVLSRAVAQPLDFKNSEALSSTPMPMYRRRYFRRGYRRRYYRRRTSSRRRSYRRRVYSRRPY